MFTGKGKLVSDLFEDFYLLSRRSQEALIGSLWYREAYHYPDDLGCGEIEADDLSEILTFAKHYGEYLEPLQELAMAVTQEIEATEQNES